MRIKSLILFASVLAGALAVHASDVATVTTAGGVKMVKLSGGEFTMGDDNSKAAAPAHAVTLAPFYMDATEVTQEEYMRLMEYNPSYFAGKDLPVERTRWVDAIAYCNKRSEEEGLTPAYDLKTGELDRAATGYRLPTEAEWEYAARAGGDSRFYFGDDEKELGDYAWYRNNSEESTHQVASKKPNAFGLFDMYGNVTEWCHDIFDAKYYASSPTENPFGADEGATRVLRGGSWRDRPRNIGSAVRIDDNPVTGDICQGYDNYGFRCVRPAAE